MLLHTAVSRVREVFPRALIHFASPLAENPGFLLSEFSLERDGEFFTTEESPVSQTLIILSEIERMPQQVGVRVLGTRGLLNVSSTTINRRFRGVRNKIAAAALTFTGAAETSIIYANDAHSAEEVAKAIAAGLPEIEPVEEELQELIDFMQNHIHRSYALIEVLRRGVAYHYGAMPHVVRARIEDLVRTGKIRFVCCTSTLLQGVNLPAKNLFVQQPMRGRKKPMSSGDFWNLAGRAGRLRYTFTGNVWCLENEQWAEEAISASRLRKIRSSFRETLTIDAKFQKILDAINDPSLPSEHEATKLGEQAFSKVVSEYSLTGISLADSQFSSEGTRKRLLELDVRCRDVVKEVVEKVGVPSDLLRRSGTVSPWKIRDLWQLFTDVEDIQSMFPPDPRAVQAARKIQALFKRLDDVFFRTENESYKYFGALACRWCLGDSLRELISNRITYYSIPDTQTNTAIRDLLEALERDLHYKYVKYLRVYNETLAAFLQASGKGDLVASLVPLHFYIEFGASDKTTLSLIAAGLSRMTALLLMSATRWPRALDRDDLMQKIQELDLATLQLPELCRQEIRSLFKSTSRVHAR
ncbi:hypothetical protein D7Y13_06540 [Corallococcus praedator]|uniref:Helicase C-terminal domain-containing protein n=2 Tax=Myxococcaceae TaxID=31 RepID=A0ABX9QN01_9BACT|nr:hypothetical protein D7X75_14750 [Corallococcus sp. CA031C]RKI14187.1 hypothetical protein D7Y13_06525 [Corallococcus praedator]RKI14188.1 hypothetical protein D7Y13_06540 [Corallococcus praedator]